ncbi:MAG TPA: 16S rRNA (cytidine(1402)-2'-O)-methyltransferase, partial [Actinomycetes bacterium]
MSGKLVVCGTPIGNLDDASPRLATALAKADLVACEDTRQTRKLLARLGVATRTVRYDEVGERARAERLADQIAGGAVVALVTDAGMPAVSDPGYHLVGACLARDLAVEVVPGPSAVLAALVLSGLPSDRFCFEGFPPRRAGARDRRLAELAAEPRTMVFFEAPHRLHGALAAMVDAFGAERRAAVCRELTKTHEEVRRGRLPALVSWAEGEVRGEVTVVVAGATPPAADLAGAVRAVRELT